MLQFPKAVDTPEKAVAANRALVERLHQAFEGFSVEVTRPPVNVDANQTFKGIAEEGKTQRLEQYSADYKLRREKP